MFKLTGFEMKRRGRVQDNFKAGNLGSLFEGIGLSDVGHDHRVQPVFAQIRVGIVNLLGLFLRADGGHNRVAPRQKGLENVCCREDVLLARHLDKSYCERRIRWADVDCSPAMKPEPPRISC